MPLGIADLEAAMALVRETFMEFEAPDYEAAGIANFLDFIRLPDMEARMAAGDILLWGAYRDGDLVGVIATRRGGEHINLLFVHRDHHRRGIARALFGAVRAAFPHRRTVTVNASPYGLPAYLRMGFVATGPEVTRDGIRFIPMIFRDPA